MNLKTTLPLVGTPSPDSWAQVFSGESFVCAISLTRKTQETNLAELGKSTLENLKEDFQVFQETSVLNNLKLAVEKNLESLLPQAQVEIAVGVFVEQYAYFCVWGKSRVCVFKDGRLLPILIGQEGGLGSCSGKINPGDIFILGTQEFFSLIDDEELARSLAGQDMSVVSDNLAAKIHQNNTPKLAAEIVEVGNLEEAPPEFAVIQEKRPSLPKFNLSLVASLAKRLPEQIKSASARDRPRRTAVLVGIILLFVLIASVFLGIRQRQGKMSNEKLQTQISQAQTLYNDSKTQIDVNPGQARLLFSQAQAIVLGLEKDFADNPGVLELKHNLEADSGTILGKITETPQTFLDLSLVRSDVSASEVFTTQDRLIVLDQGGKRLISVTTAGRDTIVVGGAEKLSQAKSASFYNSRYLVLTDSGVKRVARDGTTDTAVEQDSDWGEIVKISIFSGNLYLLTSEGKIWRYTDTGTSFGNKTEWSKEMAGASRDFAIDGFVWILGNNGSIKRYSKGTPENFQVKNLEQPLSSPKALYTDEDIDSLYVLDNSRIVEIDKVSGEFKKEYLNEEISQAVDLTVSKTTGKIYLLTPTKVLELPLR